VQRTEKVNAMPRVRVGIALMQPPLDLTLTQAVLVLTLWPLKRIQHRPSYGRILYFLGWVSRGEVQCVAAWAEETNSTLARRGPSSIKTLVLISLHCIMRTSA